MSRTPQALAGIAALLCVACGPSAREQAASRLEGIQPGEARDLGEGVVLRLHRVGVSAPDGGWQRARSSQGGFEVDMPLAFNDLSTHALTTDGVRLRTDTIGGKTPGLVSISATCTAREDGALGPAGAAGPKSGETERQDPFPAHSRTRVLDGRSCVMVVEAQGTEALPDAAIRQRFFDSLGVGPTPPSFAPELWKPNPPGG